MKLRSKRWTSGIGGAFALLIVLLAVPASSSAASTCPGKNGKIAVSGQNGIALIGQGGGVRWLLRKPGAGRSITFDPSFSCSGKSIAYVGDNETTCPPIEIVNVATGKRRFFQYPSFRSTAFPVGGCGFAPSFLRDGRLLFGVHSPASKIGTYVADADSRHRHRLFRSLVAIHTADARWFLGGHGGSLILLDSEGRQVRPLTPQPARPHVHYLAAGFSPDGGRIVYARAIDTAAGGSYDRSDLYVVRRDGTHRRRLTRGGHSFEPSFSPDGRWIAFVRGSEGFGKQVVVMPLAHPGRARVLAEPAPPVRTPTWGVR